MAWTEKYISSLAGGGGSGTEASPYTLDEFLTNAVAGDRGNVKADGSYAEPTAGFTNNGSVTAPIGLRGYGIVPGDGIRATLSNWSNFSINGGYLFLQSLYGDFNYGGVCLTTSGVISGYDCAFVNVQSGACIDPGRQWSWINSRFVSTGESPVEGCEGSLVGCYLQSGGTSTNAMLDCSNYPASIINCALVGNGYQDGVALSSTISTRNQAVIAGNVFYGFSDAIYMTLDDGLQSVDIVDNIIYTCSGYGIQTGAGANVERFHVANNAMGNLTSGRVDSGIIEELDPIVLTGDPFIDAVNGDFRLNDVPGAGRECRHMRLRPPTEE